MKLAEKLNKKLVNAKEIKIKESSALKVVTDFMKGPSDDFYKAATKYAKTKSDKELDTFISAVDDMGVTPTKHIKLMYTIVQKIQNSK